MGTAHLEQLVEAAERQWLDLWIRGPSRLIPDPDVPQVGSKAPVFTLPDPRVHLAAIELAP